MKTKTKILILTVCWIFSEAMLLYPFTAAIYNSYVKSLRVVEYEESVSTIEEDVYTEMLEAAYAWNEELYKAADASYFPEGIADSEIYESLLNIRGDGMMGYVVIPKIDVSLAIYHYVSDEILEKGAGHMQASALPVGGENTHCVITAHRGLPTATMFTDLDQLEIGDLFYLKVLDEVLTYEVSDIQVVEPDETASLMPVRGKDLCTLVTCTPYGINTHRLLVTGTRVDAGEDDALQAETEVQNTSGTDRVSNKILLFMAAAEAAGYGIVVFMLMTGKGAEVR